MPPALNHPSSHSPQPTTTSPPASSNGNTSVTSLASSTSNTTASSRPATILSAQVGARIRGAILHNPFRKLGDGGDGSGAQGPGEKEGGKAGWKGKKWWWKAGGGRVSPSGQGRVGDGGEGAAGKEDEWYWDYDEEEVMDEEDPTAPGAHPPVLPSINVTGPFSAGFDDHPDGETTPTKRRRAWAGAEEEGEVEMLIGEPSEHIIPGMSAIDTAALLPTKRLPLVRLSTPKGSTFNLLQTPVPSPTLSARPHDDAERVSPSPPTSPTSSPSQPLVASSSSSAPPAKAPLRNWHPPAGWDKKFDPPQPKPERVWPEYIKPFQLKPAPKPPPAVSFRRSFLGLVKEKVEGKVGREDEEIEVGATDIEDEGDSADITALTSPATHLPSSTLPTTSTPVRRAPAPPLSTGDARASAEADGARAGTVSA
ncbi:hypothetical protein IAT38_004704 [Cryptococcus sp. DSM 104549]